MKEFCNFQNCGLSFTLFNKLVWALIMENGCREREREGEQRSGRERLFTHFPFHKICFCSFLFGNFIILGYLDNNLETAEGKVRETDIRRHVNPSIPLSPLNMVSES